MAIGNAHHRAWECPHSADRFSVIQWALDWCLGSAGWHVGFTELHRRLPVVASFPLESLCSFEV